MNFLGDENVPAPVIAVLREQGHDVLAVTETMPGASDADVLTAAVGQGRLLLTLDRDYGDLIFHYGHPAPVGVVLFRLAGVRPQDVNRRMVQTLENVDQLIRHFTTVTEKLIRSKMFPR